MTSAHQPLQTRQKQGSGQHSGVSAHQAASPGSPGQLFCTPGEPGGDTKGDLGPRSEGRLLPGGTVSQPPQREPETLRHTQRVPLQRSFLTTATGATTRKSQVG